MHSSRGSESVRCIKQRLLEWIIACKISGPRGNGVTLEQYLHCCSFYGLLLDNTKELRKTLEDGNAVIDNINDLRGAECTDPSFDPPTAQPARITGMQHVTHCICKLV